MERLRPVDRFLRYVEVDTQSDENTGTSPSTAKQHDLAKDGKQIRNEWSEHIFSFHYRWLIKMKFVIIIGTCTSQETRRMPQISDTRGAGNVLL